MSLSFAQLLPSLVLSVVMVVPMWRILPRTGIPAWVALLMFLPLVGFLVLLVLLWVIAFRRWPQDDIAERFS